MSCHYDIIVVASLCVFAACSIGRHRTHESSHSNTRGWALTLCPNIPSNFRWKGNENDCTNTLFFLTTCVNGSLFISNSVWSLLFLLVYGVRRWCLAWRTEMQKSLYWCCRGIIGCWLAECCLWNKTVTFLGQMMLVSHLIHKLHSKLCYFIIMVLNFFVYFLWSAYNGYIIVKLYVYVHVFHLQNYLVY